MNWFPSIPVGLFAVVLAVLGAIVSIIEFQGWRRWAMASLFILLGAGEVLAILKADALHDNEVSQLRIDLEAIKKQTDAGAKHTHVTFLSFSTPDKQSQVPFHAGQSVHLLLRFWNSGDYAVESSRYGGIIRVVPIDVNSHQVWDTFNDKIEFKYIGPAMPATHLQKDYIYREIDSDKPLTKDEAAGLMAYPATKKLCVLGKAHWQDTTGRYETLHFLCIQHESTDDTYFSIGIGEEHNSEHILSQLGD
jgi:hypothetical protein